MDTCGTLSILVVRALHLALAQRGVNADALLRDLGIAKELLRESDARLPAALVFKAIQRAADLTGDEAFSLRAADAIPLGTIDVLDFAMRSSATMREALDRAVRYYSLIDDRTELRLEARGGIARVVGTREIEASPRAATELLFALLVARGRQLTGRPWRLREVCFFRGPPANSAAHEAFFGTKVRFGCPRNELVFDESWLDSPCTLHDPALGSFLDQHADRLLERIAGNVTFLRRVKQAIAESVRGSDPALEKTAKRMSMSPRTLQRRLEDVGTSHSALALAVRRELALNLLADPALSIPEVGYLAGFCDTSTFYRAFKRWTGSTPAHYRRRQTALRSAS